MLSLAQIVLALVPLSLVPLSLIPTVLIPTAYAKSNDGSVIVTPEDPFDFWYSCPVVIGGQLVNLTIDTTDGNLVVLPDKFNISESNGWNNLTGYTWNDAKYGSFGSIVGTVDVAIGGTHVSDQAVQINAFTFPGNTDGILGLGFTNDVSPNPQTTFFENANSSLSASVFTVDFKHQAPGTMDFGFIDSSKYMGRITYTSVTPSNGNWMFTGSGYAVGNEAFRHLNIQTVVNTSSPFIFVPEEVVKAYYQNVPGVSFNTSQSDASGTLQGAWVFNCSTKLPDLVLGIEHYRAVIPGQYINYQPVNSTYCLGGVANASSGLSTYGSIFLKSQFVVFDFSSNLRLGVARKSR